MELERAIEFILDQQAKLTAAQAKTEESLAKLADQQAGSEGEFKREIAQTNQVLRRAIRLGVQEARAERKRRLEADVQLAEDHKRLQASQEATAESLRNFMDSLRRGTNGSSHQ